jgi:hypothetical protein
MQPIKLFKNFLLLFKWNALTWQVFKIFWKSGCYMFIAVPSHTKWLRWPLTILDIIHHWEHEHDNPIVPTIFVSHTLNCQGAGEPICHVSKVKTPIVGGSVALSGFVFLRLAELGGTKPRSATPPTCCSLRQHLSDCLVACATRFWQVLSAQSPLSDEQRDPSSPSFYKRMAIDRSVSKEFMGRNSYRSLTDIGGGNSLEGAGFPHTTHRPSLPTVSPFHLRAPPSL